MVDAERRLLANALLDLDNQYFALMSDTYAHTADSSFLDICTSFCALMSFCGIEFSICYLADAYHFMILIIFMITCLEQR
jgi:hypothetical protein